jgi:hypothetical protein
VRCQALAGSASTTIRSEGPTSKDTSRAPARCKRAALQCVEREAVLSAQKPSEQLCGSRRPQATLM